MKVDLQEGVIYRVSRNVRNPKPDRRQKKEISCQEWIGEGTLFTYRGPGDHSPGLRLDPVPGYGWHGYIQQYTDPDLFPMVVRALEPAPEKLKSVLGLLESESAYSADILMMLVDSGKITLDDIKNAGAAYLALDEKATDEVCVKHGYPARCS